MFQKLKLKNRNKKILILIILFFSVLLFMHFQLRPIIKTISSNKAKIISNNAVNEAVLKELSENKEEYSEMVKMKKLENGELTAIVSDMEKINKLKSKVGLEIQKKFLEFKDKKIKVPFGTLTGLEILSGVGPEIPMKISITGNVTTEFKSLFKDAGINQTIYQIYLCIQTKICVSIPGCSNVEEFKTNFLVLEMVVLGKVPNVYSSKEPINSCIKDENLEIK